MSCERPMDRITFISDFLDVTGGFTTEQHSSEEDLCFEELIDPVHLPVFGEEVALYAGDNKGVYLRIDSPEFFEFILEQSDGHITLILRPMVLGSPNLPDSPVSAGEQHNEVDPITLEDVKELPPESIVHLRKQSGNFYINVGANGLLLYLMQSRPEGRSVFDVTVDPHDEAGSMISIDLNSHELWYRCLFRGHDGTVTLVL